MRCARDTTCKEQQQQQQQQQQRQVSNMCGMSATSGRCMNNLYEMDNPFTDARTAVLLN
jgi:hypothetical protein